jgi:excisionase family DNA binding protein
MPVVFKSRRYYRTSEVCQAVGVSRTTLWRWIKAGILVDTARRDRRGWRLFTETDLKTIKDEAQKVNRW